MALNNQILYRSRATANVLDACMLTMLRFNKNSDKINLRTQPHYIQPEMETVVHWYERSSQKVYVIIPKCWYILGNT